MEDRYHRQRIVRVLGPEGQSRLRGAHAVVVGVGALGCVSADWLVRAGVGRVTVIDRDIVDRTNLHRQTLFTEPDAAAGLPKADAARSRLRAVNGDVDVRSVVADVSGPTAEARVCTGGDPDVIVDGTDNFETRYVLNDVSVKRGIPLVYAGVVGVHGTVAALVPGRTACLRCIAPNPPAPGTTETCDTAGVLGPAVGVVASMQAMEALKICAGRPDALAGALVSIDAWTGAAHRVDLASAVDPACPCCAERRFEFLEARAGSGATVLCGRHTVQVTPGGAGAVSLAAIADRLGASRATDAFVRAELADERREDPDRPVVVTVFADGRALVSGVSSADRARSIYARYVGL